MIVKCDSSGLCGRDDCPHSDTHEYDKVNCEGGHPIVCETTGIVVSCEGVKSVMKWQETLLTDKEMDTARTEAAYSNGLVVYGIAKAQAEKSYKAGVEAGRTKVVSIVKQNNLSRFTDVVMDCPEYWDL